MQMTHLCVHSPTAAALCILEAGCSSAKGVEVLIGRYQLWRADCKQMTVAVPTVAACSCWRLQLDAGFQCVRAVCHSLYMLSSSVPIRGLAFSRAHSKRTSAFSASMYGAPFPIHLGSPIGDGFRGSRTHLGLFLFLCSFPPPPLATPSQHHTTLPVQAVVCASHAGCWCRCRQRAAVTRYRWRRGSVRCPGSS